MSCDHTLKNNMISVKEKWFNQISFYLMITNKCNLECIHCLRDKKNQHAPMSLIKSVIDQISLLKDNSLLFSGGEALIHPQIYEAIEYASKKNVSITLVSNGKVITSDVIKFLKENNVFLSFSLDGLEQTHNKIRNSKSSFNEVLNAMKICRDNDFGFSVISSIAKSNLCDVTNIVELAVKYGALSIRVQPISALGSARQMKQNGILLDDKDMLYLYNELIDLSAMYLGKIDILSLGQFKKAVLEHGCKLGLHFGGGCHSNTAPWPYIFGIDTDGEVYPHAVEVNKSFSLGNLNKISIQNLVDQYYSSDNHLAFLSRLRSYFDEIHLNHGDVFNTESFVLEALV